MEQRTQDTHMKRDCDVINTGGLLAHHVFRLLFSGRVYIGSVTLRLWAETKPKLLVRIYRELGKIF